MSVWPDTVVRVHGTRTTNAQAIADAAKLGYLPGRVLDMTFGLGRFWTIWRPDNLTTNDIDPNRPTDLSVNYRGLNLLETVALFGGRQAFDTVVFDPPYKLNGQAGSHASDAAYGVATTGTEADRMGGIHDGVAVACELASRFVLVKCQDQVVSGRKVWQTDDVTVWATAFGRFRKVDQLLVQGYRAQPPGRRQLHARQDFSTLLVFERVDRPANTGGDET